MCLCRWVVLGRGERVNLPAVCIVGDDVIGEHVYSVAKQIGLDISHCRFVHGDNGCARVQLVGGDRVFLTGNKGGVSRTNPPVLTALDEEYIRGFDLVHTSVYS